jgi:putative glutamine amidotransferase
MPRPRIGITIDYVTGKPHYMLPWSYADAVAAAGGLPVLLPYRMGPGSVGEYLDGVDAVVLAGGDDVDAGRYGEAIHPDAKTLDPDREQFDLALLAEIERRRQPVLGVCLGCQEMNVHRGGSLIQFLPEHLGDGCFDHRRCDDWDRRHPVELGRESGLAARLGKTTLSVNTSHKQAVRDVGRGLRIIGWSDDGVAEAVEDPSLPFFVGVQWHPERQHHEADHLRLFELLVHAAACR